MPGNRPTAEGFSVPAGCRAAAYFRAVSATLLAEPEIAASRVLTDRQQVGHLIAAPLIPLKSHQQRTHASSGYSGPRPSQAASKAQKHTNVPKHVPTGRVHSGAPGTAHSRDAPGYSLVSKSACWDSVPGLEHASWSTHAWQGPDQKVQMLLTVPPGQAGNSAQEGPHAPTGFYTAGGAGPITLPPPPHTHTLRFSNSAVNRSPPLPKSASLSLGQMNAEEQRSHLLKLTEPR